MNKKITIFIGVAVAAIAAMSYLTFRLPAEQEETQSTTEAHTENSEYDHVHSVFKRPDETILMGAHMGAFQSADGGRTFERMQIQSGDPYVNLDDKFMNFAYDATNKILFAGTHDSGLLKSMDFGLTWEKSGTGIDGLDIHGLAMNPLDSKRIYVYSVGYGLYGTDDGGVEWYKMDDGPKNPQVNNFTYMPTVTKMDTNAKRENSTQIGYLWAASGGGLHYSYACFCGWSVSEEIPVSETIYALAADPWNRDAMLLARKDGLYRTADAGETFTLINPELKDVGAFFFDLENPGMVIVATNEGIIYTSDDSGVTWESTTANRQAVEGVAGAPSFSVNTDRIELGEIDPEGEYPAEFIISNSGNAPLEISDVRTSCMCTFGKIVIGGEESPEFNMVMHNSPVARKWKGVLNPGESATARIVYKPHLMPVQGSVERFLVFTTNDLNNTEVQLGIHAIVK